jgi:NAD(P)H dehydrogenase (quinone)
MSYVITGATGHLGRLVVEDLLESGVPAQDIVATGRNVDSIADLAARGVQVRHVDFGDASTLDGLFAAGDRVLLVSGTDFGQRVEQHRAVAEAAAAAGVAELLYTSAPRADTTPMRLATDHRLTEEAIAEIGLPAVILRNGWYFENYLGQLDTYLGLGTILGSSGDGRVSGAARADYAAAASAVLSAPVDEFVGQVLELGGDDSFSRAELAAAISQATGREITFTDVPAAEHVAVLVGAGVPEPVAEVLVDVDASVAQGALVVDSGDLRRVIGRPTTTLDEAVAAAVSG